MSTTTICVTDKFVVSLLPFSLHVFHSTANYSNQHIFEKNTVKEGKMIFQRSHGDG